MDTLIPENSTVSENPFKLKYKILTGIFLLLVLGVVYIYIYQSKTYLMQHSKNIQTGSGVEKCRRGTASLSPLKPSLCEFGYYQVAYPTHKRIFYYSFSSNSQLGSSVSTRFLEGVDGSSFKVLNQNY